MHLIAEDGGASGKVVDIDEAYILGGLILRQTLNGTANRLRRGAALVAAHAQVHRLITAVDGRTAGEGHLGDFVSREFFEAAVAGGALEAVGGLLCDGHALFDEERQTVGAVALAAAAGHLAVLVPVAESFFRASEVTHVDAVGVTVVIAQHDRLGNYLVQVFR